MKFYSTRDTKRACGCSLREAAMMGLAPDGGLFVPERIPQADMAEVERLAGESYAAMAGYLAGLFFGDDFDLFAENAALGVVFVGDDASRVKARHTVGNEVAGVCTGNADFDRIGSMHRGGHGHDGHTRKSRFHPCACHKETSPSFIGIVGVIGQARLSEAVHAEKGAWGEAMPSLRFFG